MNQDNRPARTFIEWLGFRDSLDWSKARTLGGIIGFLAVSIAGLLILGALGTALAVLWHTFTQALNPGTSGPNLGAGALIATILGAPFLIWGTVIKQKTVDFQKEGHLTDRISKAVEQLGAEKSISSLMRTITYRTTADGTTFSLYEFKDKQMPVPAGAIEVIHGEWKSITQTRPNIEVRIGGLLSLERIAQDSVAYDKGRDHVRVMEIICAYVRENAPASEATKCPLPDWEPLNSDATEEEKAKHIESRGHRFNNHAAQVRAENWTRTLPKPREDLALAVHIIGRRTPEQKRIEARWGPDAMPDAEWVFDVPCPKLPEREDDAPLGAEAIDSFKSELETWERSLKAFNGYRPDLRNTNLQRHDLSNRDLSGCLLTEARLEGADLRKGRLQGADLQRARLDGAELIAARLEGANFLKSRLEGADLRGARLVGANLQLARLEESRLANAELHGAFLVNARLETAGFQNAGLELANLGGARLEGTNLSAARLEGVNFSTPLQPKRIIAMKNQDGPLNPALAEKLFESATIQGAALSSVSLKNCSISPEQLRTAFGDGTVTDLPVGMAPPSHWPTTDLEPWDFETEWRKWQADPENYTPPDP